MIRRIMFVDNANQQVVVLPVTPQSFRVSYGIAVETINIHTLGDVNLAGNPTLASISLDCLFPSSSRPYTYLLSLTPYEYVERFKSWAKNGTVVRMVIWDTQINIPVLIESIEYGEQDGTNDVYATLSLREYRAIQAIKTENRTAGENQSRPVEAQPVSANTYIIQKGDTLSAICRKFYGDGTAKTYNKLAQYNGIKNPNLIYAGNTLKIPAKL